MMSLTEQIRKLELDIGFFSKNYKILNGKGNIKKTEEISFEKKPAQQLLMQLGGDSNSIQNLTNRNKLFHIPTSFKIKSFSPKDPLPELEIEGSCLNKAMENAKIYVNTALFPEGDFAKNIGKKIATIEEPQNRLQNLAVAVCHAQIIYPLTKFENYKKESVSQAYSGHIKEDNPGILLLSSPRLNFKDGYTDGLSEEQQIEFVEGMYRNLFQATLDEGRKYLAMPAAGLGKSGGTTTLYFSALMKIANEFPELNIIYHPGNHEHSFKKAMQKVDLPNVAMASKDIISIAQRLTDQGYPCALHIPSSPEVIYGLCDVGGLWKEKKKNLGLQEYIGIITTAPINSYGFNPQAYQRIVERKLLAKAPILPTPIVSKEELKIIQEETKVLEKPNLPTTASSSTNDTIISAKTGTQSKSKQLPKRPTKPQNSANPNILFPKPISFLSQEDLKEVNTLKNTLQAEWEGCWPFNKDLKLIKIDALNELINKVQTMPVKVAIEQIKTTDQFKRATEGYFSTRLSDLFKKLAAKESSNSQNSHPSLVEGTTTLQI